MTSRTNTSKLGAPKLQAQKPRFVSDEAWQACMAEISDIITRPFLGVAEIGYDPMNSIGLAIATHLNFMPGSEMEISGKGDAQ